MDSDRPPHGAVPIPTKRWDIAEVPGRGAVFGEILVRSTVLATAGGAVIGLLGVPAAALIRTGASDFGDYGFHLGLLGLIFGTALGVFLGLAAGLLLGAVGAVWLVPYRGERVTVRLMQVLATLLVAAWFPLLLRSNVYDDPTSGGLWGIIVPSVVAAWYVSPGLVAWYVTRMTGTMD